MMNILQSNIMVVNQFVILIIYGCTYSDTYTATGDTFKPIFHCGAKNTRMGPLRWAVPPMGMFCNGDTTMLVFENAKICVTPNAKLKIYVRPNVNPNSRRWNIGCVRVPNRGAGIGHVHFMLFVSISFVLGTQRKPIFEWNMGYRIPQLIS